MSQLRIQYYSNRHPKVGYSFIRGGILAFMCQGLEIQYIALCGRDADLVDAEDLRESSRSLFIHSVTNELYS